MACEAAEAVRGLEVREREAEEEERCKDLRAVEEEGEVVAVMAMGMPLACCLLRLLDTSAVVEKERGRWKRSKFVVAVFAAHEWAERWTDDSRIGTVK